MLNDVAKQVGRRSGWLMVFMSLTAGIAFGQTKDGDAPTPYVEVREYLADQTLYAPSINTVTDAINLGPENPARLTIELDVEGYVQQISCR